MTKFIPSRALVSRPSDPSWWTPECSESVTAKQRTWKRMTQAPSPQHLQSARQATRSCTAQLQRALVTHTTRLKERLARGNLTDKQWWPTIKRTSGEQRNSFPTIRSPDGTEHVFNKDKANFLVNTLLLSAASTRTTSLTAIFLPHDSVHSGSSATFTSARLQYSANYSDSSPPRQLAPTTYLPEF